MFCSKCGNKLEDTAKFCNLCGNQITTNNISKPTEPKVDRQAIWSEGWNAQSQPISQAKPIATNIVQKPTKKLSGGKIALIVIALCITFFLVVGVAIGGLIGLLQDNEPYVQTTEEKYLEAVEYYNNGSYEMAKSIFEDIEDYSDSKDYIFKCTFAPVIKLDGKDLYLSTVKFGKYKQDYTGDENDNWYDLENYTTDEIEWNIIKKDGNKLLLWSSKILDYQPFYSDPTQYIAWENLPINNWLNNDFYNSAFSDNDKKYILNSAVVTTDLDDQTYTTNCNVFLISSQEHEDVHYNWHTNPTEYSEAVRKLEDCHNGVYTRDQQFYSGLFGGKEYYVPGIIETRSTGSSVYFVKDGSVIGGIRPCIWVDCSSIN